MRAIRARYNPYVQARGRVDQLRKLGHSVDKVRARWSEPYPGAAGMRQCRREQTSCAATRDVPQRPADEVAHHTCH